MNEPRALAARTYLLRNPRRVVPVLLVLALVTALLFAVITPTNIFRSTSEVYVRPLAHFTIVTPRLRNDFDASLLAVLDANEAQARREPAKMFWIETPMIVGEAYAPLVALDEAALPDFLDRVDLRLVAGALPAAGGAGAAIHEDVLRARGLEIGDAFGQLVDPDDTTPGRFEVVGVLAGPSRLGVVDLAYASIPDFVLARRDSFHVVYAQSGRKAESDAWLRDARDEEGRRVFRVIDEAFVRGRLERNLRNLPLLIGFLTGAVALIVALVVGLLNLILFHGRVDEFALLLAVGHRRGRLVRKLGAETLLTALVGWLAGIALGLGATALWRELALEPKGIVMALFDPRPFLFSLAVPAFAALASSIALAWRLRRMDPVAVIQRRGT